MKVALTSKDVVADLTLRTGVREVKFFDHGHSSINPQGRLKGSNYLGLGAFARLVGMVLPDYHPVANYGLGIGVHAYQIITAFPADTHPHGINVAR